MSKVLRKPNLFIMGAMKSGTSSLQSWLGTHPDVFMCEPKEPCYFVDRVDLNWPQIEALGLWRGEEFYLNLFENAGNAKVVGESSTLYTKAPRIKGVPRRIQRFNPDARFVYLMRDPIERTISHYWHMVQHHGENRPLDRSIRETPDYCDVSYYAMQLRNYFEVFGAKRVLALTFEELVRDPLPVVQKIFAWLEVDASFVPPNLSIAENVTPPVVTQVRGRGLLNRFRYSPIWSAVGSRIPTVVRRFGRSLSERTVERDSRLSLSVLDWLRSIQRQQTEPLKELLNRDFPEWTMLYGEPENESIQLVPSIVRGAKVSQPR